MYLFVGGVVVFEMFVGEFVVLQLSLEIWVFLIEFVEVEYVVVLVFE